MLMFTSYHCAVRAIQICTLLYLPRVQSVVQFTSLLTLFALLVEERGWFKTAARKSSIMGFMLHQGVLAWNYYESFTDS